MKDQDIKRSKEGADVLNMLDGVHLKKSYSKEKVA